MGHEFENFSEKAAFLVSSGENRISLLFPPTLEKLLEVSTSGPLMKKYFRCPWTQTCKVTPFL